LCPLFAPPHWNSRNWIAESQQANLAPLAAFLRRLGHSPLASGRIRLSSIGFLDTFDAFDSFRAALPENFLQLVLLSVVSVLVCDLLLQKSAIA
jgi:hypothetical protein